MTPPYYPIEQEKPIPTLSKPLIIETACPGWLSPKVNPNIPFGEKLTTELVASIKAGASILHCHASLNPDGTRDTTPLHLSYKRVLDPILEKSPDVITWNHTWVEVGGSRNYIKEVEAILSLEGGIRYVQGAVVLISSRHLATDSESIKEGIRFLEKVGIKPIFQFYDTYGIKWFRDEVLEAGVVKWKPYVCNLHMGKHDAPFIDVDPWGHFELLTCVNMLKATIPDCIVGVYAGGRNWLPITVTAITLGVDVVRVGMEDALWIYPHRDEIIEKNSAIVTKIATISREIGRELATPEQVRKICMSR